LWLRKRNFGKLSIYFDADCGFCRKSVYLIREFFLLPEVSIKEAQSDSSIHKDMEKNFSWVVVNETGNRFFKYDAWIEILKHSPLSLGLSSPGYHGKIHSMAFVERSEEIFSHSHWS
jgi:hypothetical protein